MFRRSPTPPTRSEPRATALRSQPMDNAKKAAGRAILTRVQPAPRPATRSTTKTLPAAKEKTAAPIRTTRSTAAPVGASRSTAVRQTAAPQPVMAQIKRPATSVGIRAPTTRQVASQSIRPTSATGSRMATKSSVVPPRTVINPSKGRPIAPARQGSARATPSAQHATAAAPVKTQDDDVLQFDLVDFAVEDDFQFPV